MSTTISDLLGSSSLYSSATSSTSSSTSSLFSSLSSSSSSDSSTSILGDYASIKSGSYKKLLKAYYSQTSSDSSSSSSTSELTSTEKKQVTLISSDMVTLKTAADALKTTGSKSLFKADSEGNYDMDALYEAAKNLVDAYNSALDSTSDISITAIDRKVSYTENMLAKNSSLLEDAGITIKDNKLSIDETKFKEADISTLKTLFNGSNSIASKLASRATDIYSVSQTVLGKSTSMYNSNGTVKTSASSGSVVDTTL